MGIKLGRSPVLSPLCQEQRTGRAPNGASGFRQTPKEDMEASINIESFPKSEFGNVTGKLIWVGSDALPPTKKRPFYNFTAKIKLESKSLSANGKKLPLQSGMAVNCSIKVRKRTVLSIFLDMFDKKVKSLETVSYEYPKRD